MRNQVKNALCSAFAARGFIEVETPALQISAGVEPNLMPFETKLIAPDGTLVPRVLHTSPEIAMKKLLIAGETRIFQFAPVFRNEQGSDWHHPAFTMLEYYAAGGDYGDAMALTEAILCEALPASQIYDHYRSALTVIASASEAIQPVAAPILAQGSPHFARDAAPPLQLTRDGHMCGLALPWRRLSVADAFQNYAGIDLTALLDDFDRFAAAASFAGVEAHDGDRWDDLFFRVMAARIEPNLGFDGPVFLYDYPPDLAALARTKPEPPHWAERFELYICGAEIANGYSELTDPAEQDRRFAAAAALRQKLYRKTLPLDPDFAAALRHGMPKAAGVALGFDRLVMLVTGAAKITDVLWVPVAPP